MPGDAVGVFMARRLAAIVTAPLVLAWLIVVLFGIGPVAYVVLALRNWARDSIKQIRELPYAGRHYQARFPFGWWVRMWHGDE